MSEAVTFKPETPPEELSKFAKLTYEQNGEEKISGVYRNGHKRVLTHEEVLEAYGHDPHSRQAPIEAVWQVNDSEIPVKVTGAYDKSLGSEVYLKIEGSDTGVPRSQIEWPAQPESAAIESMPSDIEAIKQQLNEMASTVQEMKEKIDELTERNKSLEAVNLQLRSELAKARGEEPEIPPETDTPLESQPEPEPPPETEPAPSDVPPAIEPANTESKEGFRTRWNRLTGRLGSFMLGRQAAVHNGVYSYVDRRGRKVVVDEEVVDGYPESNRRAGAYALIGAIGAVALVGIAYWLGTRGHNGPDIVQIDSDQLKELSDQHIKIENNQQEILEKINQGVINPDGTGIGGFEREYLGGTLDNHSIAVDLPRGANLIQNAGGKYDIVGPGGNIWVKNIEWDRQGNLAEWVRSSLTNKNLEVAQHHLTYLDNHGPGRHGLVKHFVTAISTKG